MLILKLNLCLAPSLSPHSSCISHSLLYELLLPDMTLGITDTKCPLPDLHLGIWTPGSVYILPTLTCLSLACMTILAHLLLVECHWLMRATAYRGLLCGWDFFPLFPPCRDARGTWSPFPTLPLREEQDQAKPERVIALWLHDRKGASLTSLAASKENRHQGCKEKEDSLNKFGEPFRLPGVVWRLKHGLSVKEP